MVALAVLVWASPVRGQTSEPPGDAPAKAVFLPRTAFHMTAEHLSDDDPRYVWDANFGGELDLVGYGTGRFTFEANYQVILGEQIRAFDPNQGNYILAGAASVRVRATEIAAVLYHQSRHLADRPKQDAVDWNMFGGRVRRRFVYRGATIDGRADLRGVFMKSFVDYSWELDAGLRSDVNLRPGVGLMVAAGSRHLGVDGSLNRGNQTGFRVEGGVRLEGRAGAIELFVSAERRIDPFPLEVGSAGWVTAGFRLLSRESGR
jgi:hypothetical protein